MSLSQRYRQLAALIEALESYGITVQAAEPVREKEGESSSDGGFSVELSVELPADAPAERSGLSGSGSADAPDSLLTPVGTNTTATPVERGEYSHAVRTDATAGGDESLENASEPEDGQPVAEAGESTAAHVQEPPATAADRASTSDRADPPEDEEVTSGDAVPSSAVPCTHPDCDRTFETQRGMKIHRTKAHPLSELAEAAEQRTVHHNPEVLATVYKEHETFAEMTAALDVDVGAQAVRKQMIRHGIHEPGAGGSSDESAAESATEDTPPDAPLEAEDTERPEKGQSDAASDSDDDEPSDASGPAVAEQVADRLPDLDLPGSLSAEELQSAVETANTLYDVQRELGLDQQTTRDVLTEYDLLELVSGRAASLRDREELKAEIDQRIRRTAT